MTRVTMYVAILACIVLVYLLSIYFYQQQTEIFMLQLIFGGQIAIVIVLTAVFLELLQLRRHENE